MEALIVFFIAYAVLLWRIASLNPKPSWAEVLVVMVGSAAASIEVYEAQKRQNELARKAAREAADLHKRLWDGKE